MLLTVAICTYNRAESLRRTLQSLTRMKLHPNLDWELVLVNNNCTDHSEEVIAAFADQLPLRRVFQPVQGLSHARNCAVEAARGCYIIWTDDDVVVEETWLAAYADAFARWPDGAVFGGPIIPTFESPTVPWVVECEGLLGQPFAAVNFGDSDCQLSVELGRLPHGANFAIRTDEQRQALYNPALGVAPGRRRLGEESDVIARILRSGAKGFWIPAARVLHCISRDRQSLAYIANYFMASGETEAAIATWSRDAAGLFAETSPAASAPLWFGVPRYRWRQLVGGWLFYRLHHIMSPARLWLPHLIRYSSAKGAIKFRFAQRGNAKQRQKRAGAFH